MFFFFVPRHDYKMINYSVIKLFELLILVYQQVTGFGCNLNPTMGDISHCGGAFTRTRRTRAFNHIHKKASDFHSNQIRDI